jgi:hypothetical protein
VACSGVQWRVFLLLTVAPPHRSAFLSTSIRAAGTELLGDFDQDHIWRVHQQALPKSAYHVRVGGAGSAAPRVRQTIHQCQVARTFERERWS